MHLNELYTELAVLYTMLLRFLADQRIYKERALVRHVGRQVRQKALLHSFTCKFLRTSVRTGYPIEAAYWKGHLIRRSRLKKRGQFSVVGTLTQRDNLISPAFLKEETNIKPIFPEGAQCPCLSFIDFCLFVFVFLSHLGLFFSIRSHFTYI